MNVYKKLMQARVTLQGIQLAKSGHNKFAGYRYFELGDFLPTVQKIFSDLGLCGIVSFFESNAQLAIIDTEDGSNLTISSPMSTAALKGCHEVQNLGAVQTYLRRYLWVTAMEIVEHDALDSSEPVKEEKKEAPKPVKKEPKKETTTKMEGRDMPWQIKVEEKEPGKFVEAAVKATMIALDMAESSEDVMNIFKVNREIFDAIKEQDAQSYEDLLAVFKSAKESFAKE